MLLLVIASAAIGIALVGNAIRALGRASPTDSSSPGPWGVVSTEFSLRHRLDPAERRWRTQLIAAKSDDLRWRDLVRSVEGLHELAGTSPDEAPDQWEPAWLDAELARLAAKIDQRQGEAQ